MARVHAMSKLNAALACLLLACVSVFCVSWYSSEYRLRHQATCPRIEWDKVPEIGPYAPAIIAPITKVEHNQRKRMYAALEFERKPMERTQ